MATLEIIIVFAFAILGWIIESEMKKLREHLSKQLSELLSSTERLRTALCGDERIDRMVQKSLEVGAELSKEEMAYSEESRYLSKIEHSLGRIEVGLTKLTTATQGQRHGDTSQN